jgi:hypothetical protein
VIAGARSRATARLRRALTVGALVLALSACDLLGGDVAPAQDGSAPYPAGCAQYELSDGRCERIVAWAGTQLGLDPAGARTIELLGDPGCGEDPPDGQLLCARSTQFIVRIRFLMADGRSVEESLFCGVGGRFSSLCSEQPELLLLSPTRSGYFDTPEGASPVPTAAPDALADARPLEVPAKDIPIDHVGSFEVRIGEALLPNGLLTEATFEVQDTQPDDFQVADGVHLEVEPRNPDGPPLLNVYEAGWREGTRPVEAFIRFEVVEFRPGAVLALRNIVIR